MGAPRRPHQYRPDGRDRLRRAAGTAFYRRLFGCLGFDLVATPKSRADQMSRGYTRRLESPFNGKLKSGLSTPMNRFGRGNLRRSVLCGLKAVRVTVRGSTNPITDKRSMGAQDSNPARIACSPPIPDTSNAGACARQYLNIAPAKISPEGSPAQRPSRRGPDDTNERCLAGTVSRSRSASECWGSQLPCSVSAQAQHPALALGGKAP
ncbi:MAG: hypothetical protein CM15mP74_22210 [Halieaceae bacterium]|nr:MAG: hypothetical protein CM15mP74_22210 [Halieaceae bacterium]